LIAATRFPNDFDAIVARAPAYSFTELFQAFVANAKAFHAPGGAMGTAKVKLIADAVVAQCDAADGVKDGLVSNVEACTFDPAVLRCSAGADTGETCLSDAQVRSARTVYGPTLRADGSMVYPGWGPGGEDLSWATWLTSTPSAQFLLGSGLVKYWVTQDPAADLFTFDPEKFQPELNLTGSILDATPDLREFLAQGRKLILVHGTHDAAISYKGTVKYFNDVATKVGGAAVRDAGVEFFLQPGVQHCRGGVGPDTVELVDAVAKWADGGKRPSEQGIVSRKLDATGATLLARPLCRYPTFPKYKGTGDVNSADSYTCQAS
jgi:feruloyl esterase